MEIEKIVALIFCIGLIAVGVALAGVFIYRAFIYPRTLTSDKWIKTEAKVIRREHSKVTPRPSVTSAPPQKVDVYEKVIEYTAGGKTYEKTLPDSYEGSFEIYYNAKKPNKFLTSNEMRTYSSREKSGMFAALLVIPVGLIAMGIFFLIGVLN